METAQAEGPVASSQNLVLTSSEWSSTVTLRSWRADEEVGYMLKLLSDDDVVKHLPWRLDSLDQARDWVKQGKGGSTHAIEIEGDVKGFVGIVTYPKEVEIGYVLEKSAWGHGYATRIVAGLIQSLVSRPLVAYTDPANVASQRVLQRNGFLLLESTIHRNMPRLKFIFQ